MAIMEGTDPVDVLLGLEQHFGNVRCHRLVIDGHVDFKLGENLYFR